MHTLLRQLARTTLAFAFAAGIAGTALAQRIDQTPTWPNDLSPAGMRAAISHTATPEQFEGLLPASEIVVAPFRVPFTYPQVGARRL